MAKEFNITGTCIPARHYIGDISEKIKKIYDMVSRGYYFTINRPRQYGKTTTMYLLEQEFQKDKDYLVIDISFESIDTPTYSQQERFIPILLDLLKQRLLSKRENKLAAFIDSRESIYDFFNLNLFFSELVEKAARKVVLLIDEVDKSANNRLFLDFLGMLRVKFLKQKEGKDRSFHSVILAGVHDIKTLKAKLRFAAGDESREYDGGEKYNSPWNIAVDFKVDLSLFPEEIRPMLEDYAAEKKVVLDSRKLADKIFYYTSGYPFLVSYLCKIVDDDVLPGKPNREWSELDLDKAFRMAVKDDNTNYRSLVKNLENNPELYDLVFKIIMNEREFSFNPHNAVINYGMIFGILKEEKGKTRIHNRLYEQLIYNYMASNLETSAAAGLYSVSGQYTGQNGTLNIEKVIRKFQQFMKEQYSDKDRAFIERNGRLLFLAFLKPIINDKGFDFKEVQISEEKRIDVVVTCADRKYIIELKLWRGEKYHREGIEQLCDYLDRQDEKTGYLLIFDMRKESGQVGKYRKIAVGNKEIFAAWV